MSVLEDIMKVFSWLYVLCTALPVIIASGTPSLTDIVKALPACASSCFITALPDSTCSPTDQQCICTNVPLNAQLDECVLRSCTIKQTLTSKNLTSAACNLPIRDKRKLYNWTSNSLVIASWLAFILRIASRLTSDTQIWWDDVMVTVVMIVGIPSAIINVQGLTSNGLGKDIWTLTFKNISDMIRFFYAAELLYFAQVSFVKISILFFFLRLFPDRKIRWTIWGTIIMNVIILIIFELLAAFQCRPISFYWKGWDEEHAGTCLDINALAFTSAGVSIVMDIWILTLPLTQLYDLNLHWKKKIGVGAMLCIGIVVTVVSILRLKSLVHFSNTKNPTWDYVELGYWSTIEICVGIICSCMPAMRLLLVRLFPRFAGTTNNSSDNSKSLGYGPSKRRSSIPKLQPRNSARNGPYAGQNSITMQRTFDVISSHRVMSHDKEMEEDDTELVIRPGTSKQRPSYDNSGDHLSPDLDQKTSARSVNEEELTSPRSPDWV